MPDVGICWWYVTLFTLPQLRCCCLWWVVQVVTFGYDLYLIVYDSVVPLHLLGTLRVDLPICWTLQPVITPRYVELLIPFVRLITLVLCTPR